MDKIPCPPAPKHGYKLLYDHKSNTWVFIKQVEKDPNVVSVMKL
jgi:hypothetical protein